MSDPQSLKNMGLKATFPRLKILELFEKSSVRHLTAEDVYRMLISEKMDIGLATVYRALADLATEGEADALQQDGESLYRACTPGTHHHHLICQICGNVTDVDATEVPSDLITFFESETGFDLSNATIQLNGTCAGCSSTH